MPLSAWSSVPVLKELLPKGAKPDVLDGVRQLISKAKNDVLSPEAAMARALSPREREAADIYAQYQRRLTAFNALDFDDLIRLPVSLLSEREDLATVWRERLRYLLVDEYQDSNPAQYALVKLLAGSRGMFTCVGDDDQSIYAWRGANPENLNQLSRDYPNLRLIKLEQNYRCAKRILRAANALIANNPHEHLKALWSEHVEGEPIRVFECRDDEHEAERVAAEIDLIAKKHKLPWSEFAEAWPRINEVLLTGGTFRVDEALAWGIVSKIVPIRELPRASMALALEMAETGATPPFRSEPAEVVVAADIRGTNDQGVALDSQHRDLLARTIEDCNNLPFAVASDVEAERAAESFTLSSRKIGVPAMLRGKPPQFEHPLA